MEMVSLLPDDSEGKDLRCEDASASSAYREQQRVMLNTTSSCKTLT